MAALKRGLRNDLVVAPYATMLAMLVEPHQAIRNLAALETEGALGPYGFRDAADYTRPTPGKRYAIVGTYMAHHIGMGLVALTNALAGSPATVTLRTCRRRSSSRRNPRTCSAQVVPGVALRTSSPPAEETVAVGAPRTIRRVASSSWETRAKSCASCTDAEQSIANPVWRQAMTSEWSPKIDRACVASVRAVTCMTNGVSSPAILYMFGIISRSPCEAVNVVASAPACSAPWTVPAAASPGTSTGWLGRDAVQWWQRDHSIGGEIGFDGGAGSRNACRGPCTS